MKIKNLFLSILCGATLVCSAGCSENGVKTEVNEETWNTYTKLETYKECEFEYDGKMEYYLNGIKVQEDQQIYNVLVTPLAMKIRIQKLDEYGNKEDIGSESVTGEEMEDAKLELLMPAFVSLHDVSLYEYNKDSLAYELKEESQFDFPMFGEEESVTIHESMVKFKDNKLVSIESKVTSEGVFEGQNEKIIIDYYMEFKNFGPKEQSSSKTLDEETWNTISNWNNFDNVTLDIATKAWIDGVNYEENSSMKFEFDGDSLYRCMTDAQGGFQEVSTKDDAEAIEAAKDAALGLIKEIDYTKFEYVKKSDSYKISGTIKSSGLMEYQDLEIKFADGKITKMVYVMKISQGNNAMYNKNTITFSKYGTTTLTK